jgi:multicomponent Na+:H+ antiporter subunit G
MLLTWLADGLILLGLLILTIAIAGLARLPDLYTRLHAASVAGFVGIVPFLAAAATTGARAIIYRVILIGVFLLLTSTVATHAIAHAAHLRGERPRTPGGAVDRSPHQPGRGEGDVR